jgi:hypothetical protein
LCHYICVIMKSTLLVLLVVLLGSCGFYGKTFRPTPSERNDAWVYVPTGRKQEKMLTFPASSFTRAIKDYKLSYGSFPQEMHLLKSYSNKAMQDMTDMGYTDLRITYLFLDSMEVDFIRVPKWTRDNDYRTLEMRIAGKFVFSMKDSSMFTQTVVY